MSDASAAARRLREALELWEDGVVIMRERLRRRMPDASADEIDAAVAAWLAESEPPGPDFAVAGWPRERR